MKRSDIARLDRLVRKQLRAITKQRCESCGVFVNGRSSQTSHANTRRHLSMRWDRLSVLHLCASCHTHYEMHKSGAEQFLRKHLGDAGYEEHERRWRVKVKNNDLDPQKIAADIKSWQLGQYPKVSPKPVWEL